MLLALAVNRYYDIELIENMLFISPFLMPILDTTPHLLIWFFVFGNSICKITFFIFFQFSMKNKPLKSENMLMKVVIIKFTSVMYLPERDHFKIL